MLIVISVFLLEEVLYRLQCKDVNPLNWAPHEHSTSYLSKRQRPELECVKSYHGKQISFATE